MVFNSLTFACSSRSSCRCTRCRSAWTTKKVNLLIASYVFYAAWNPPFILLLWISTVVDWCIARGISRRRQGRAVRRSWIMMSRRGEPRHARLLQVRRVPAAELAGAHGRRSASPTSRPTATSSCRSASRSIRSRRCPTRSTCTSARAKPTRSFLDYALFVTFFPHLVAGPIMRPTAARAAVRAAAPRDARPDALGPRADDARPVRESRARRRLPRARRPTPCSARRARPACRCVARRRSPSAARSSATSPATRPPRSAPRSASASRCRTTSASRTRRSASPISGGAGTSRCRRGCATTCTSRSAATAAREARTYVNLMMTMLLGGLWHGASWTFVVWGGLHGLYLAVERVRCADRFAGDPAGAWRAARWRCSRTALVNITWVFFRATTFDGAARILAGMFGLAPEADPVLPTIYMIKVAVIIARILVVQWLMRNARSRRSSHARPGGSPACGGVRCSSP